MNELTIKHDKWLLKRLVPLCVLIAAFVQTSSVSGQQGKGDLLPKSKNYRALQPAVVNVLEKAERIELYSLDPEASEDNKEGFHGWKVLGKVELTRDKSSVAIKAVIDGNKESNGRIAKCYEPRHGIRLKTGGRTLDLVICFECGFGFVYGSADQEEERFHTNKTPQEILDKLLNEAKVPLTRKSDQ